MSHPYHPQCGCSQCDEAELADERRDEVITKAAAPKAAALIGSEDFAWGALVELPAETKDSVLQDVGRFFERYHALADNDTNGAMALARALYLDLLPQIEAAAKAQAREEAADEYDALARKAAA